MANTEIKSWVEKKTFEKKQLKKIIWKLSRWKTMANDEKNESGFAHDHNKRMLSRRKAMTNKNNEQRMLSR